jgi:hypothetical protein
MEASTYRSNLESLLQLFLAMETPQKGRMATAEFVNGAQLVYLVRTDKGRPAFLIERPADVGQVAREVGQIRINSLQWGFAGKPGHRPALLVTLLSPDPGVLRGFLIAGLGFIPEILKVDDQTALRYLEDLAAALNASSGSELSARGLWAELFVMELFPTIDQGADAWQRRSSDRYDFGFGKFRIEVKSYAGPTRRLKFRHQQMHAAESLELAVISLRVSESAAGVSLTALATRIVALLSDPAVKTRVMTMVDKVCSLEAEESELLFDIVTANETVALTPAQLLPRLPHSLPDGVIDAHLDVELSESQVRCIGAMSVQAEIASNLRVQLDHD